MVEKSLHKPKPDKYLFFHLDGRIYTSKLADIKEVVTDLMLEEIPMRNYFAVGMSSLRGEIISIFSLGKLLASVSKTTVSTVDLTLDEEPSVNLKQMVTLIVEHNNLKYGLIVDSIKQVDVLEADRFNESSDSSWIRGHYRVDSRIATVLSLRSLLERECP